MKDRVKEDLVSLVTMSWAWKLIESAAQGSLKEEDYPTVPHSSADLVKRSDKYFDKVDKYLSGISQKLPNLYFHLTNMFIGELTGALLVKILVTVLLAVRPLVIGQLIAYLDPQTTVTLWFQEPKYTCAILVGLYILTPILDTVFKNISLMIMVRFDGTVQSMLFEKAMRLSSKSRIIYEAGYLINVYNRDLNRVNDSLNLVYKALSPFLYLIINLVFLSTVIGWITVFSLVSLAVIFFASYMLSLKVKQLTVDTNIILDSRMKVIRKVVGGIRNVKISNLTAYYLDILDKSTDSYISKQSKLYIFARLNRSTVVATSAILVSVTLVTFNLTGNSIDPALVFPAYIYLNSIAAQMKELNPAITQIMNAPEGFAILSDYFCSEEISLPVQRVYKEHIAIKTINVKWKWYDADYLKKIHERRMDIVRHGKRSKLEKGELVENKDTFELGGVNLEIEQGSLVGVVGTAGSGKTTLFNGLVNELQPLEGE
ncbi:ATP-binding cassette sub- C member 8, partial [Boothiomyces sp. JEL0866]